MTNSVPRTSRFGDWILKWNPTEPHKLWNVYGDAATLLAQLEGVAKGYEQWEADMVLDPAVWRSGDGLPHLTQHLQDKLMLLQKKRTDALAACKEFMEKYQ